MTPAISLMESRLKMPGMAPLAFFHLSTTFKSSRLSRRARLLHLEMAVHSSTSLVDRVQTNFTGPYLSSSAITPLMLGTTSIKVLRQPSTKISSAPAWVVPFEEIRCFSLETMKDSVRPNLRLYIAAYRPHGSLLVTSAPVLSNWSALLQIWPMPAIKFHVETSLRQL